MNIKIENLTKRYGTQKAVDDISFEVKTGEILGFLGPNGAGKSTTMKMITQFLESDTGTIYVNDLPIESQDIKGNIGYLAENNPLYEDMPVIDYLEFMATLQSVPKDIVDDRIKEMIVVCGLDVEKHKKIGELSKGFKQRVGLAQAMIHDPDILILDEPTTGLDPNQIVEIRELIRKLGSSKTVILSTHILPEVEATCDRILIINKGKIVADGTAETLRKSSKGSQLLKVRILGADSDKIMESIEQVASVLSVSISSNGGDRYDIQSKPNTQSNEDIFTLCAKKKWVLMEMIPFETKLEDIFRDLTLN